MEFLQNVWHNSVTFYSFQAFTENVRESNPSTHGRHVPIWKNGPLLSSESSILTPDTLMDLNDPGEISPEPEPFIIIYIMSMICVEFYF